MNEIYFGNVDPARIKDKKLREKYKLMIRMTGQVLH